VFRKVVASVLVAAMIGLGFTQAAGPAFAQVPASSGQAQAMERLDRF
jgi:hypothetical protein